MLTLTLALGITVSLVLAQLTGLSAGGIIAPGYVALMLDQPNALVALALVTGGSWLVVASLGRFLFLWGTRRFGLTVLVALVLGLGLEKLRVPVGIAGIGLDWGGLGYIVPGLIAHQIDRQGWIPTVAMVVLAAALVRLAATLVVRL